MLVDWSLSLLPILMILFLMVVFRWGAAKAGPVGWFTAALIAALRFGLGLEGLAISHSKGLLLTLDVLLIVWAAFLLYRVVDEAGAIEVIGKALPRLTSDPAMQALLIGWAFASTLQGVGGFGVPVAVTAPLLVGLGFTPMLAVVIPSIGHGWAVTFGSLASSFQALMAATGLPGEVLGPPAALLLGFAGFACGFAVAQAVGGWDSMRGMALPILAMGAAMGAAQYLLVAHRLWNLGGFGGGVAGMGIGVLASRWTRRQRPVEGSVLSGGEILLAVSGYLILSVIILVVQLVEPVHDLLSAVRLQVEFPEVQTRLGYTTLAGPGRTLNLLSHAGALLLYGSVGAYFVYRHAGRYSPGTAGRILSTTVQRMTSSSLGIASMVAMAVIMAHAGMTDVLARGLSEGVGRAFPLISPWIGALGAFMTGSNTNSNVVFSMLQLRTAELLGLGAPLVLAAQTAGGAIGSVIAPTKIIVGASTAEMAGKEGLILRSLLPPILSVLALVSLVVWGLISLGGG